VVEKFNDHYRSKFLTRVDVPEAAALGPAHRAFEEKHNSRYRYSKLGGQTPLMALQRAGQPLRFPTGEVAPRVPLPKPEAGCYHLVRFIRSDRRLDIFGERFLLPPEAEYAYVVATVDVARQRLRVMLGADLVTELRYQLRRLDPSFPRCQDVSGISWHIEMSAITWHLSLTFYVRQLIDLLAAYLPPYGFPIPTLGRTWRFTRLLSQSRPPVCGSTSWPPNRSAHC
jgi:hypothetical protein